jgi:hypothetical protein
MQLEEKSGMHENLMCALEMQIEEACNMKYKPVGQNGAFNMEHLS